MEPVSSSPPPVANPVTLPVLTRWDGPTLIGFAENQLSPSLISLSPLTRGRPSLLPQTQVRPGACPGLAHSVSGVTRVTRVGYLRRRACYPGEVVNPLCKRYAVPPLLRVGWVWGSFSLPCGGSFHLSLTVLFASVEVARPAWKVVLPFSGGGALLVWDPPGGPTWAVTWGALRSRRSSGPPGGVRPPPRSLTTTGGVSVDWSERY